MRILTVIILAVSLGGCGATGAGIGLAALTGGASILGGIVQEDVAEAAEWRGTRKALVAQVQAAMLAHARSLENEDWDKAMEIYEQALEFSIDNQPDIFLERMKARLEGE